MTTTRQAPDAPRTTAVAPVYVYGVVRAGSIGGLAVKGIADRPVSTIERGGLVAIASELAGELRVRRRDLHRHLEVLEATHADTTVVPCAFGMVLQSRQAVEDELLTARREELLALLKRFEARMQLNIRAFYDEERVLREVVAESSEVSRLSQQSRALGDAAHLSNIRLGELVASALDERRAVDGRRVFDRLVAEADDVAVEEAPLPIVLKASFLVSRNRSGRFDAALEELATSEGPRISFESIGPLPPTAFVTLGRDG